MALSPNIKDREMARFDKKNNVKIALHNLVGEVDVQNPLPTDGDSIYVKDIDAEASDNFSFSGEIADYFNDLSTVNSDSSVASVKKIKVYLKRTIYTSAIGLGCSDTTGSFSNIKIELLGSGEAVRETIDNSADDTKYNSKVVRFAPAALNGFIISFLTTDEVKLSNITVRKDIKVDSQLEAQRPDGTMAHIKASRSDNLQVTDAESGLAIAKGEVLDTGFVHKFGDAPNFSSAEGFVTVWDGADTALSASMQYLYSATANIDGLSSTDDGDTQVIEVQGLDAQYNIVTQSKQLSGRTLVALDTPLLRVFRMKNIGSTDIVGHVYCTIQGAPIINGAPTDPTDTRAIINDGNNQTLMAILTIPAGYTGYMRDWYASASAAKRDSVHQIQVVARPFGQVFQMKHKSSISINGTSYIQHTYSEPEVFIEKTDIEIHANSDQADAGVSAGFDIVLVKNQ